MCALLNSDFKVYMKITSVIIAFNMLFNFAIQDLCKKYIYNHLECALHCNYSCFQNHSKAVATTSCDDGYSYDESVYEPTITSKVECKLLI